MATPFNKYVFAKVNEERFKEIYSNEVSRPNTPINILIRLRILKENFKLADEDLICSLQYALGTTSYQKQPVSINTLTNFRKLVLDF